MDRLSDTPVRARDETPGSGTSRVPAPKVLAVFERSCYAGSGPDLLLCLGLPEIGRGPLNLLIDLPPGTSFGQLGLRKGEPFKREPGGSLTLGGLRVLLDGAEIWTPEMPAPARTDAETTRLRIRSLARAIESHPNPPGLGGLAFPALAARSADIASALSPLATRALPYACDFSSGMESGKTDLVRKGAKGLIGLGPGLTPAGDDFLGGCLTALRCAENGGGFETSELNRAAAEIRDLAAGRTPLISEALLRRAVEGASAESVHRLLTAILSGSGPAEPGVLGSAVRDLARHGHSSGWDALAGVAWALRSILERIGGTTAL
ncbi:MAG: DUF2877 domain-containing protein [Nitrospinota bacterium]|nr:DUF2877 domain-containing protein [Nitrospinota bacterium]HJM43691.1 DUF2877 domain-containing protein [Nitrospinota bacterium]